MKSVGVESFSGVTRCQLRSIKRAVVCCSGSERENAASLVCFGFLSHLEEVVHLSWRAKASSFSVAG